MAIILELDCFDAEAYDGTTGELVLTLNGQKVTDFPYGYLNLVTPGSIPPCTANPCNVPGWGGVWRHPSLDITPFVTAGTNTMVFSEVNGHSSGIANVVVKDSTTGQILGGPFQLPTNLSSLVGPPGTVGGCGTANCYVFNSGQVATFTFTGVATPRADFTFSPLTPGSGQPVAFQAAASGGTPPYTYDWNWGDATAHGTGISASHTFAVAGSYNVILTVRDSAGISGTAQHTITATGGHVLSITSTPSPIAFTINGQSATTPFSSAVADGSYTVTFPQTIQVGGVTYTFSGWLDGLLNPTRAVNVAADTSLGALYTGQGLSHTLSVQTTPNGVAIMINGASHTTPFSNVLPEAIYTIIVPQSIVIAGVTYNFQSWSDGTTSLAKIVSLLTDVSLGATFAAQGGGSFTLSILSTPININFTLAGVSHTTPFSSTETAGAHTITMNQTQVASGVTYSFKNWSDGNTSLTRTINLAADTTLTVVYQIGGFGGGVDPLLVAGVVAGVAVIGGIGVYAMTRKKGGGGRRSGGGGGGPR